MIFVPSEGGISHSPREYTTEAQIEKGNQGVVSDTDSYGQNEVGERK